MKIGIVTITCGANMGNRLQNYALQKYLQNKGHKVFTLFNTTVYGDPRTGKFFLKALIKKIFKISNYQEDWRLLKFNQFNKKYIKFGEVISTQSISSQRMKLNEKYNMFITGSDQVWNPNYVQNSNIEYLAFAPKEKSIAYAASFGVSSLTDAKRLEVRELLSQFKEISVREDTGAVLVYDMTGTKPETVVDPTFLLTEEQWSKMCKKPGWIKDEKYVLLYFFGEMSTEEECFVKRYAEQNDCSIVKIPGWKLEQNNNWNYTKPDEFLWLIKNSERVFTDSFHGTVFSILFKKQFLVFDRKDKDQKMNSRIDTLLKLFQLSNCKYGDTDFESIDFSRCCSIIEEERAKADRFLERTLS